MTRGRQTPGAQIPEIGNPYGPSNLAQTAIAAARFKHAWADARKVSLSSTCMLCSAAIATDTDEISLLAFEQRHVCIEEMLERSH